MPTLQVNDFLKDAILVSRESARLLEDPLRAIMEDARAPGSTSRASQVVVDFEGVAGVAPSFLDELLLIFESLVGPESGAGERSLVIAHPPTRLSLKFEAVARGHAMSVRALPDGSWLLADVQRPGTGSED